MDFETFMDVQKRYSRKVGNDFLMPNYLKRLFSCGLISVVASDEALFLFEQRYGFSKLYFRLLEKSAILPGFDGKLAAFLTFRDNQSMDIAASWLQSQGFTKTKTIRRYTATAISCDLPYGDVERATSDEAYSFFREYFTEIEADMPCPELFEGALCVRSEDGRLIGALYMGQTLVVAVAPEARGQGVGRKLYRAYADVRAIEGRKPVFHEWISPDNTASIAMFKNLGFTPDNVLTETYIKDA